MRHLIKNEHASLTLEAAMVMPFFLLFIVFLATMIRIGIAEIALNHAASQTTEVIATHVYPAALLDKKVKSTIDTYIQDKSGGKLDLKKTEKLMKDGFGQLGLNIFPKKIISNLSVKILTPVVQRQFAESAGSSFFEADNVKVVKVGFPGGLESGAIDLVVAYKMKLFVPFVHKTITLKRQSYEKLWTG